MVSQGVALINGAKHEDAGRDFLEWFGGAEMQGGWSRRFGTAPVNRAAAAEGDQSVIDFTDSFKTQDIDWSFVAENIDSWVEEIELKYIK